MKKSKYRVKNGEFGSCAGGKMAIFPAPWPNPT